MGVLPDANGDIDPPVLELRLDDVQMGAPEAVILGPPDRDDTFKPLELPVDAARAPLSAARSGPGIVRLPVWVTIPTAIAHRPRKPATTATGRLALIAIPSSGAQRRSRLVVPVLGVDP